MRDVANAGLAGSDGLEVRFAADAIGTHCANARDDDPVAAHG